MKQTRTRALCECAIMLALAVILSFIQFGKRQIVKQVQHPKMLQKVKATPSIF